MFEIEKKYVIPPAVKIITLPEKLKEHGFVQIRSESTRTIYLSSNQGIRRLCAIVEYSPCPDLEELMKVQTKKFVLGYKWLENGERREQEEEVTRMVADTLLEMAGTDYLEVSKFREVWRRKSMTPSILDKVHVDIDECPEFGSFVELEVQVERSEDIPEAYSIIEQAKERLGIYGSEVKSYYEMALAKKRNFYFDITRI